MCPRHSNPSLKDSVVLLHASKHLGVLTGSRDRVCDANDAFLKMAGLSREKRKVGQIDWNAMFPGECFPLNRRHLEELRTNGTVVPFEKECCCPDGTFLPVLMGAVRFSSRPLKWVCWVVNLRGTKEIRKIEQQTRELKLQLDAELRGAYWIHEISNRLMGKSSVKEVLNEILRAAIEVTGAELGNIQLVDQGILRIVVQRGCPREFLDFFSEVSYDTTTVCCSALHGRSRVIVEDVATDRQFRGTPACELLLGVGIRAVQSTPLVGSSGELYGMLSTHFRRPHRPTERALRYLDLLGSQAGQVLERLQYAQSERREERLRASAELAACLAHEINNPIQALTNIFTLLTQHEVTPAAGQQLFETARDQLSRISKTVRKMLAVNVKSTTQPDIALVNLFKQVRIERSLPAQLLRKME